jgi:hypothetical protein
MYAPVERVRVERAGEQFEAVIEGRFTSTCMQMAEHRLVDSGRTHQLLPIAKMAEGGDCRAAIRPLAQTVRLPAGMAPGRHLLHVRSLNGKAQNAVFTVD